MARVSEFFFHKESKSRKKKKEIFCAGDGGGVGRIGGRGRWKDRRTGSKQFAPSISSKLGA